MIALDITTTACNRIDIIEKTYKSFTENLTGVDWNKSTLYINIDPVPYNYDIEKDRDAIVEMCHKYFGYVVANRPIQPNFTRAYNWIWSHATKDIILNLEDDWELIKQIDIDILLQYFKNISTLYQVVLRAYTYHYPCTCASPSLLHRRYYHAIGGKMDELRNPETQTHSTSSTERFGIFIPNKKSCPDRNYIKKYVVAYPEVENDNFAIIVKDIGREWLIKSNYDRPQNLGICKKDSFVKWIKKS